MIAEFLEKLLGWQVGTATLFFGMTVTALSLLNKDRKEELALWLMGAMPEESWHKTFFSMFDALFYGPNHSRVRFFLVSALISTCAISAIWYFMYRSGNLRIEMGGVALWEAILIGIAINIFADYISLLETRFLLSRMPRNALLQVSVLLLDTVITGAIILATIWLAMQTGWVPEDRSDPLTVMLAFSIYSAPFYSTFLTSVWSWLYILLTWILRVFRWSRLPEWLDVENKPVLFISLAMSVFLWLFSTGVSQTLKKDPDTQLSAMDSLVCETFKGQICLRMIGITEQEETQFLLQAMACEGGAGLSTCTQQAVSQLEGTPERAAGLWRAACLAGDALSCTNLGALYDEGLGVEQDYARARALYMQGCERGSARGCTDLGFLYFEGLGGEQDYAQARALYLRGCENGSARGCSNLGFLYDRGLEVEHDYNLARSLFRQGCKMGDDLGCASVLGQTMLGRGRLEISNETIEAYHALCNSENPVSCYNLGIFTKNGHAFSGDAVVADSFFRRACALGFQMGCNPPK